VYSGWVSECNVAGVRGDEESTKTLSIVLCNRLIPSTNTSSGPVNGPRPWRAVLLC
jgi:hypothetical protein